MPHHRECWEENGRCTTVGCPGQAPVTSASAGGPAILPTVLPAHTPVTHGSEDSAIVALMLGIASLFIWFIPAISSLVAILGVILGVNGLSSAKRVPAIVGLICSILGGLASVAWLIFFLPRN